MTSAHQHARSFDGPYPHPSAGFVHAAVGFAVTDLKGRFLVVNETFSRITGYSFAELRDLDARSITHSTYIQHYLELVDRLIAGEIPAFVYQKEYVRKNGETVWVRNSVSVVRDALGRAAEIFSICEDVTERKAVQEALRESEERFRVQFKATPVPIFSWRSVGDDFVLVDYNDAADRMTAHGIINLLGRRASQLYVDTPEVIEGMQSCFNQRTTIRKSGDFRLLSTGELKRLDVSFVFAPPDLVMIHTEDITERRQAELDKLEAERQYREMFENANEGMFQTTVEGRFLTANPAMARIFGFSSAAELIRERTDIGVQQYVDPERREELKREIEQHGFVQGFEYEAFRKDRTRLWVSSSVRAVRDQNGGIVHYEGITEDITQRKLAETALRDQKQLLQTIFDHIPVMINFIDEKGRILLVNQEWEKTLGWTQEEVLREGFDLLNECYPNPVDRERVRKFIGDGSEEWANFRLRAKDGHYIDTSWANVLTSNGTSIGIGQDVSQAKRAERFRAAAASLSHGLSGVSSHLEAAILIINVADELIGWDSCSLQLYDTESDLIHTVLAIDTIDGERKVVTPNERRCPTPKCRSVIENGPQLLLRVPPFNFEDDATPFGDTARPSASFMAVPICYGENVVSVLFIHSYQVQAYDETSLKDLQSLADLCGEAINRIRAEQSLSESEEKFRQVAENIEDVIWVLDTTRKKVLYVNPSFQRIWGKSISTGYGVNSEYLSTVHPDDRERVGRMTSERIENSSYTSFEYRIVRPDGDIRWIRTRSFPIRDGEGKTYRLAGVAEDITERKAAETALRDYSRRLLDAQESERKHIARELHDDIGQVLTAVRMNLQSLEKNTESVYSLARVVEGIKVIDEALKRVRDLSFELRPSLLDDLGLAAATRWYIDRFAQRAGIKYEVLIDFENMHERLSRDVETACFRILQEALTNVGRHSHANHISVQLCAHQSRLFLSVKDDGIGMEGAALGFSANDKPTLGLRGMEERALAVAGHLEIISVVELGTEVRVSFPFAQTEEPVAHARF
jgi:PAS domain S-box-containing protein